MSEVIKALRRRTICTAAELMATLSASQATVSRQLAELGESVQRFGAARSTKYALRRNIGNQGNTFPLFCRDENGDDSMVATLSAIGERQWIVETDWTSLRGEDGLFPDIPWFLNDMRPAGFLGRIAASRSGLFHGMSPATWLADQMAEFLTRYGEDVPGAFIFGHPVAQATSIEEGTQFANYPDLADSVIGGQQVGSSAEGEQPKFATQISGETSRNVIVKFSGKTGSEFDLRWADLLAAEQIAASVIASHGFAAAESRVLDIKGQRFLEVERFDRVGESGRIATASLHAVAEAADADLSLPWPQLCRSLADQDWMLDSDVEAVDTLWKFGCRIGNNDMHLCNARLFIGPERPFRLAPCFDMLPMCLRPTSQGTIPEALPMESRELSNSLALQMESAFLENILQSDLVSDQFKLIFHARKIRP